MKHSFCHSVKATSIDRRYRFKKFTKNHSLSSKIDCDIYMLDFFNFPPCNISSSNLAMAIDLFIFFFTGHFVFIIEKVGYL